MYIPKTQMTLVLVGKGMFQRVGSARSLKIWQFDETWNLIKFCKRVQKDMETYAMYLLYLADKKAAENLARRDFTVTISDKDLFAFPASFTLFLRKLVFTWPLPPRKQIQFMPYPWDPCGYMLNHWKVCGMDSNRSLAFNIWPPWWSSLPAAGRCDSLLLRIVVGLRLALSLSNNACGFEPLALPANHADAVHSHLSPCFLAFSAFSALAVSACPAWTTSMLDCICNIFLCQQSGQHQASMRSLSCLNGGEMRLAASIRIHDIKTKLVWLERQTERCFWHKEAWSLKKANACMIKWNSKFQWWGQSILNQ